MIKKMSKRESEVVIDMLVARGILEKTWQHNVSVGKISSRDYFALSKRAAEQFEKEVLKVIGIYKADSKLPTPSTEDIYDMSLMSTIVTFYPDSLTSKEIWRMTNAVRNFLEAADTESRFKQYVAEQMVESGYHG